MMYTRKQERLGMTAIAAVLALSSTPLAAQEATSTDVPLVTVPAPEPVAPAADPLAPAPEAQASTSAETSATDAAEAPETTPAAKPVAKRATAKTERSATRTVAKAAAPVAAAPAAATAVPEAPAAVTPPLVEARSTTEPAPVEQAKSEPKIDEAIPLAGGAGAVILALAGAGMAIRRRKRSEEEEGEWQDERVLADEATPAPAPEPWNPPVVEPTVAPIAATQTDVPEDFDTSGFGRHVKAAYAGPTPENPSLSLRKRLKLAGELDRRERMAGKPSKAAEPVATQPAQQPTSFMLSGKASQAKTPEYQF
jgi:hypothetical protein